MDNTTEKSEPVAGHYAVIFTSTRRQDNEGYAETAERLRQLASQQPGFLGMESVRDASGKGITVSYWKNRASIEAWRNHAAHAETRARGRQQWYECYSVCICKIEKEYGFQ